MDSQLNQRLRTFTKQRRRSVHRARSDELHQRNVSRERWRYSYEKTLSPLVLIDSLTLHSGVVTLGSYPYPWLLNLVENGTDNIWTISDANDPCKSGLDVIHLQQLTTLSHSRKCPDFEWTSWSSLSPGELVFAVAPSRFKLKPLFR